MNEISESPVKRAEARTDIARLIAQYQTVRQQSVELCKPLEREDYVIQTMDSVSPPKWHLAHTSWFFETFLLKPFLVGYQEFHPQYAYLFNSYYNHFGNYFPRNKRGTLSRPTTPTILDYRDYVDMAMHELLGDITHVAYSDIYQRCILGLNHEQQHQELLLMDIKHIFASNPLKPVYQNNHVKVESVKNFAFENFSLGLQTIGRQGEGFSYDNESPSHQVYLADFSLANRLVTNQEYIEFIEDRGYEKPSLWLSDGWVCSQKNKWQAPLYWEKLGTEWHYMTLNGFMPVDLHAPVCHVSYYEADAYASWAGKRLATEFEWEAVANMNPISGHFRESQILQPVATEDTAKIVQLYGDVWEWTQSAYAAYPGYKKAEGALGEYNGKFMSNQYVLRGGSCVTPEDHMRVSYRNFFYPEERWMFSGFRLAE